MKKTIENSIKESLENFELPYNGEAWSAMSARLDAHSPASSGGESIEDAMKSSLENHEYAYNPEAWTALSSKLGASVGVAEAVKSSLDGHEYPYNPEAWTQLESKLPASPKGGAFKWYIAASIAVATAVGAYMLFSNPTDVQEQTAQNNITQVKNQQEKQSAVSTTNTEETTNSSNSTSTSEPVAQNNSTTPEVHPDPTVELLPTEQQNGSTNTQDNTQGQSNVTNNQGTDSHNQSNNERNGSESSTGGTTTNSSIAFQLPVIPNACQNEMIRVENNNAIAATVIYPNGTTWTGKAHSTTTLKPSTSGVYRIGYMQDGDFIEKGTFSIKELPGADFEFIDRDVIYDESGLPTVSVATNTPGMDYHWKYGRQTSNGASATPHFFTKGNHDVTLIVTGSNGCQSEVTKTVMVDENYNLMATNAFVPTDVDIRNNTFMPKALTLRNTPFRMIIIDRNDGHIIYETSDATQGWDGIDQRTGSMVKYEETYIWKVTIEQPVAGEKGEYAGTVIPLRSRR